MPKVRVIQATKGTLSDKLPVAAYCRVSSNSEDQRHSFVAQVKEYTARIAENDKWELAGIYADKGITGTSAQKRPEFQRLIEDCRQGKVKRILTKVGGAAALFIIVGGVLMGVAAALRQNRFTDRFVMILSTLGATVPSFVFASLFLYIFSKKLGWVPAFGVGTWKHYIGPVLCVSMFNLSFLSRLSRTTVLDVMSQDYIRTARAKGLPERVVIGKHVMRNALIPVVTYIGPMVATLLTGSFVIEKVFGVPGIGQLFTTSILNRDYTLIMGITVFFAIFLVAMVLVVDIVYMLVDPRIKYDN